MMLFAIFHSMKPCKPQFLTYVPKKKDRQFHGDEQHTCRSSRPFTTGCSVLAAIARHSADMHWMHNSSKLFVSEFPPSTNAMHMFIQAIPRPAIHLPGHKPCYFSVLVLRRYNLCQVYQVYQNYWTIKASNPHEIKKPLRACNC